MYTISIIILCTSILSVGIGGFVLLKAFHSAINQAFSVFAFGVALWIGSYGLILMTHNDIFLFFLNFGGLILVAGLTRFAQVFPTYYRLPVRPLLFWSLLIGGGSSMIVSNTIISHVEFLSSEQIGITHGPLIHLWSLLLLSYICFSLFLFVRNYQNSNLLIRIRLRFVFTGMTTFVVSSILFDAILPGFFGIISLNFLGPLSALFLLYSVAYGIIKHSFMDIRLVLQRSIVYSALFLILATAYLLLLLSLNYLFEIKAGLYTPIGAGITILLGLYTLPRLEAYFRRVTDPLFFKDRYDYFSILEELSLVLNHNLNLRPLVLQSLSVLERAFKPKFACFIHENSQKCFSHTECTYDLKGEGIDADSIELHIISGTKKLGFFILGPKRCGELYTHEDRSLLRMFGTNATVAFEKAHLHQKLRVYSEQLETRVEERTRYLRKLQIQQREFFDDISHALQTPLTILVSGIESLRRNNSLRAEKTYQTMDDSIQKLSQLARSILKLARIDTEERETYMSEIVLSDTLLRLSEHVALVAESASVFFEADVAAHVSVLGQESQLEEAFMNILSNAIKYTLGSTPAHITLLLRSSHETAEIIISDNGIGMTPLQIDKVFDRFYRANPSATILEGFGLGLAITKRIIERHFGDITVESELGKGTRVTIRIPRLSPITNLN